MAGLIIPVGDGAAGAVAGTAERSMPVPDAVAAERAGADAGEPVVFVIGPDVPAPVAAARRLRRHCPDAQIVLLGEGAGLERLRATLPFVPEISDAWTASAAEGAPALGTLLAGAMDAARRRAGNARLAERLNALLDGGTADAEHGERRRRIALSERYLGLIAAQSRTPVFALRADGTVLAHNDAADRLFGARSGAEDAASLPALLAPAERDGLRALLARVAAGSGAEECALRVTDRQGDTIHLDVSLAPLTGVGEPGAAVSCVARDVTEQRRVEEALRHSEQVFRDLAETVPGFVWTAGPDGGLDYQSRQWSDYSGAPPGTTLGDAWTGFVHPDDLERAGRAWAEAVRTGIPYDAEFRLRRRDGVHRWFLARAVPVRGPGGAVTRWVGTCTDIDELVRTRAALADANDRLEVLVAQRTAELEETNRRLLAEIEERRRAEAGLNRARRLEAIGKLTGGVAHDFNNLLQVIGGNLQLLQGAIAGDERAERKAQAALAAVDRGAKLASQLLAFARRQPLEPSVIDVGRLLRGMDDLLRRALGEAVEIELVIAGGLWTTLADPNQLENVVLNLAVNARDAMGGAGRLTIEAGNAMLDDLYALAHEDVTPGQYVMLAVTDTGSGMAPEVLERVFEPFFTTKPEGKGTGLGLSMVHGFVKQTGGHVKIYSEVGHGTTVRIYLPRTHRTASASDASPAEAPVVGGSETVLVVEDDPQVRATAAALLVELGYHVLQAPDARSALALIRGGAAVDLLFTDVVMPGPLRSPELARLARGILPDLAVLFTSGYTENAIVHGGRLDPGVHLLSKPYRREDLARKVRHVLSEARRPPAGLRVLLVEDDALVRLATQEMLLALGHAVTAAGDAEAAGRALAAGPFDVLFTDVRLPGRSGLDLARAARRDHPHLAVIIASGYGDVGMDAGIAAQEGGGTTVVLGKPYSQSDIAAAFRTIGRAGA